MPTTDQKRAVEAGEVRARPRVELLVGRRVGAAAAVILSLRPLAAADLVQADEGQRQQRRDDHEELQHLVVDRRRQATEGDVGEHDRRGDDAARPTAASRAARGRSWPSR